MSQEIEVPVIGKGVWVWNVHKGFEWPYVRRDTPPLLEQLVTINPDHVIIKVAQGHREYKDTGRRFNVTEELVRSIKQDMGLQVYGYSFLEGYLPTHEGKMAATIKKSLGLDGIVFDVEGKFDQRRDVVNNTHKVLDGYRSLDPEGLLINCSWAKVGDRYHDPVVIATFMRDPDGCKVFAPMEYFPAKKGWDLSKVALDYMAGSYTMYQNEVEPLLSGRVLPYAPVLRAFLGDGGWTDPRAISDSYRFCREDDNTIGGSYWSLDFLSKYGRTTYKNSLYFGWHGAVASQPRWNEPLPAAETTT